MTTDRALAAKMGSRLVSIRSLAVEKQVPPLRASHFSRDDRGFEDLCKRLEHLMGFERDTGISPLRPVGPSVEMTTS